MYHTIPLSSSNLLYAGQLFFSSRFIVGCLHIPQENAITPNQNLLQARKWAFHLLILLCKCDDEHRAQTNETIKRSLF